MAKMGRPKKEFDKTKFEKLCMIMCTEEEIAGVLGFSVDTLQRRCNEEYGTTFAEVYKTFSAAGKASLRRTQFKLAEKSASMAIWLGKQYLGQRDVVETVDVTDDNLAAYFKVVEAKADD
jgi:AraC-like DNA-binding protein